MLMLISSNGAVLIGQSDFVVVLLQSAKLAVTRNLQLRPSAWNDLDTLFGSL